MSDIESPCIQVCTLVEGVCIGCGRLKDEITEWITATPQRKQEILNRIEND